MSTNFRLKNNGRVYFATRDELKSYLKNEYKELGTEISERELDYITDVLIYLGDDTINPPE